MNSEFVVAKIRNSLENYLLKNKSLKSLVCGVSGGMDSALCVALARPVCDKLNLKLLGVSLPILTNKEEENERAIAVGTSFCTYFEEDDCLETIYGKFELCRMPDDMLKAEKVRKGNLKARLRMIYLYNLAFSNHGMVLSTDNFTEYLLGFWTKHGDEGDYGMIQYLFKTEVYEIGKYLVECFLRLKEDDKANALQSCIDAVPTDGLGISSSDLEQFGASSYNEVDTILKIWTNWPGFERSSSLKEEYSNHPVVLQHEKTHFKRAGCITLTRNELGL
jgi:NAD+ synthetase